MTNYELRDEFALIQDNEENLQESLFQLSSSINPRLHIKNKEHWVANFFFIFPFGRYVFVR